MSEIRNREFRLYICFFAAFFLALPFLFQALSNFSFIYLLLCGFFFLLSILFCHDTKLHSSNLSMLCQLHASANKSPQLHLTCVLLYHLHVGETIYTALSRDDDDNDGATEEQQSRWNLGKVNRDEWKILRSMTFSYAVWKLTHLGGGHRKIVYRHSEMAYTVDSVRQRDIPWNSVSKRDMSSNSVQKPCKAYRDRRQRD